jgi:hypothetical protein
MVSVGIVDTIAMVAASRPVAFVATDLQCGLLLMWLL